MNLFLRYSSLVSFDLECGLRNYFVRQHSTSTVPFCEDHNAILLVLQLINLIYGDFFVALRDLQYLQNTHTIFIGIHKDTA